MTVPPEDLRATPYWMAWGAYLEHVQPHDGPPCAGCCAGSTPREGCEEGQRLWEEYRSTTSPSSLIEPVRDLTKPIVLPW